MALTFRVLRSLRALPTPPVLTTYIRCKHYNPKFKWHRKKKVIELDKDVFGEKTKDDIKRIFKEQGIPATKFQRDIPFFITCSSELMDPYEPQEGDGKFSLLSTQVFTKVKDTTMLKSKSIVHTRRLKKEDAEYNESNFPQQAQDIYINAHEALTRNNPDELYMYATEHCCNLMLMNVHCKTIKWKFIESLDPPKVVHVRVGALGTKGNNFGQVTVRFHTKQMLAIYDRFGRLLYGSDILAKDVLEYVVFEKHICNVYGTWKLHEKIIPDWLPSKEHVRKTYALPVKTEDEDLPDETELKSQVWIDEDDEEDKNVQAKN